MARNCDKAQQLLGYNENELCSPLLGPQNSHSDHLFLKCWAIQQFFCSFSNGEYLKAGLAGLEQWCCNATELYAGSAWDELKHIRQAVGFLALHEKSKITSYGLLNDLCPVLSIRQLYTICTSFMDNKYGTQRLPLNVVNEMRGLLSYKGSNNTVADTFTLYDDLSIPFSGNDISMSIQEVELADVEPPTAS